MPHIIQDVDRNDFSLIKLQAKEVKIDPHSNYFQARFFVRWYYFKIVDDE